MHRLLARITLALACASLLVACSDSDDGAQEGGSSSTSDASADESSSAGTPTESSSTPTATEPTLPPEASEHTEAGAEAFVYHFIDIMNYTQETGDTDPMAALSSEDCRACSGILGNTREVYEGGGYVVGGAFTIVSIEYLPPSYGSDYGFYLYIEYPYQTTHYGDGRVTESAPGEYNMAIFPHGTDFGG